MSNLATPPPPATRGRTVGRALIRSYVHDWVHRDDARYKPLYTQAQFNRMVAGIQSEQEHRVYTQFIALYHGVVEAHARVQGYYQQAQNALGRLYGYAWDALRAEEARALLDEALGPAGAEEALPQPRLSGAEIVLHGLSYYLAAPGQVPLALGPALNAYRAWAEDGQMTPLEEDVDTAALYEVLRMGHPALLEGLLEDLRGRGMPMPEDMLTPFLPPYTLAVLGVYDYAEVLARQRRTPGQARRDMLLLFTGLDGIGGQPDLVEYIQTLRQVLLLPALSGMLAYDLVMGTIAQAHQLPELSGIAVDLVDIQIQMDRYNDLCYLLPERVRGDEQDRLRKGRVALDLFARASMPTFNPDTLAEVRAGAGDIATFERTTLPQLLSLLQANVLL